MEKHLAFAHTASSPVAGISNFIKEVMLLIDMKCIFNVKERSSGLGTMDTWVLGPGPPLAGATRFLHPSSSCPRSGDGAGGPRALSALTWEGVTPFVGCMLLCVCVCVSTSSLIQNVRQLRVKGTDSVSQALHLGEKTEVE